ncbi:hypothetical protein Tco_0917624 [Tanacetum coccineum]|uniref:Protein TIC 214 n=1 Tax=Tanacetum coccineum TaxID=301880 RepID=A0ABQ5GWT4_9ASTR
MDNPGTIMEEYVQYETEKALRNGKVYNWETAKYGKINYIEDISYLRFFETKFPAIVYDDALKVESDFSSKPVLNFELINNVNLENKTSLPKCDYDEHYFLSERKALKKQFSKKEKFNILNIDEDLFSYEISSDDNKIGIKRPSEDIFVKPLRNIINTDVDTYDHELNGN